MNQTPPSTISDFVQELFESGHLVQQLPTLDTALVHVEQRLKQERSNEGGAVGGWDSPINHG